MAARFPLQALLDQARHRLDAGERLMLMVRRKEEAAKRKLTDLQRYREEYRSRLTGSSQTGMDILMLRDFHVFLGKLETAINLQCQDVEQQRAHLQVVQQQWFEQRRKVKSYEALEKRHFAAETVRQDRREQRASDEWAGRKAAEKALEGKF